MSRICLLTLFALACLSLAACTAQATPQLIASYPARAGSQVYTPPSDQYVYDAYLELDVRSVDTTVARATDLAEDYGGYLERSQTWSVDGKQHASLTLAVPPPYFQALYDRLAALGTPLSTTTRGQWVDVGPGWAVYSEITLQLHQKGLDWPSVSLGDWRPLRTLQLALGVTGSIFGFLLDVTIWILVVIGPFALLFWGGRALFRRLAK